MMIRSIRGRLLFWFAALLVIILAGFGATAYQLQRLTRLQQIDAELERRVAVLLNEGSDFRPHPFDHRHGPPASGDWLEMPPPDEGFGPHGQAGKPVPPGPGGFWPRRRTPAGTPLSAWFSGTDTNNFYFVFWSREAEITAQSSNAPVQVAMPSGMTNIQRVVQTRQRGDFREAFHYNELGECFLAGRNIRAELAALHRSAFGLVMIGGVVLAFGLGGGGWLIRRALRPVDEITAAAMKISSGDLSQRISVAETESEMGRLALVLNATFARLETAFAQQKQFTADAAHELRTPITVLISEVQTTLARERTAADYQEAMGVCLDTAQQMRGLTESLLELARLDAGQELLRRERVDLAELGGDCLKLIRPLAAARGLEIKVELNQAETVGDGERLARVMTNLLTNAIGYNRDQGRIVISSGVKNGMAFLAVADTGIGIAQADLPRIFERFYRVDKSRSSGGNGLGLAISRAIVTAHGGAIGVDTKLGEGSVFTIRLPVATA